MTSNHVVVMPYPGRGHMNPITNLCHQLSLRFHHCRPPTVIFTVVVTEEWLQLIIDGSDEPKPDNLRFVTIPNVLPSEHTRGADPPRFFSAVQTKMEAPFEEVLDGMDVPVKLIIADAVMKWPFELARRRNIPVAAYWPMSATVFSIFYHTDLLDQHHHLYAQVAERGEDIIDYIPGLSPMKVADLPNILLDGRQQMMEHSPTMSFIAENSQYVLFTTVYELEANAINALKAKIQAPIYTFGPNIPHFKLQRDVDSYTNERANYLTWLDSKPPSSVLYVSLGSYLSFSGEEMDEIAIGLKESGAKFLWVARGETSRLSEICGNNGLVVPWCDQLRVLCHSSVGGFLSHCGWNSVKESIFAGVPVLAFPIIIDQIPNTKVVVEDWKIGWRVTGGDAKIEGSVKHTRGEIAEIVRRFMDSESVERREIVANAKNLKDICRAETIGEGGLASKEMDAFIRHIDQSL